MAMTEGDRFVLAEGTVVAVERSPLRRDGEHLWRVRYEYGDSTGARHVGHSGYLSADEAQGWQPGDIGGVRYHDGDPGRSTWTGSLLPTSAGE